MKNKASISLYEADEFGYRETALGLKEIEIEGDSDIDDTDKSMQIE